MYRICSLARQVRIFAEERGLKCFLSIVLCLTIFFDNSFCLYNKAGDKVLTKCMHVVCHYTVVHNRMWQLFLP